MLFTSSSQTKVDYIDRFTELYPYARSAFEESDYGCVAMLIAVAIINGVLSLAML